MGKTEGTPSSGVVGEWAGKRQSVFVAVVVRGGGEPADRATNQTQQQLTYDWDPNPVETIVSV
jgi:hypothetical protein